MGISLRSLPFLLLFAIFSLASEARAEHVVITSGSLSHGNPVLSAFPGYGFNFSGAGLTAAGSDEKLGNGGASYSCLPCVAGQTFSTGSSIKYFSGASVNLSSATFNGTGYAPIWFNGSQLDFVVAPVVIPLDAPAAFTLTSAFSFSGALVGTVPPFNSAPVFSVTLSGQGLATLAFSRINLGGLIGYALTNTRYDFQPAAAPVPEPATLVLLGTGLAGAAARSRRRRSKALRHGADAGES